MSEVKQYYYIDGSEIKGPCSIEYIEKLKLPPDTMCWQDGAGLETTQPIAYIHDFRHLYPTIPPPIPKSSAMYSNAGIEKVSRTTMVKTKRRKKENLYGWICVIFSFLLFFFCDVIINMAGMKNPSIRMWIDLAVVYGVIKLYSKIIDKHLDKKYGTDK